MASNEPKSLQPQEPPKRRRRRWVFSLRSLLIGLVIFCILLGLYARREPYRYFAKKADEYGCNRHYRAWPVGPLNFLASSCDECLGRGTLQNPFDLGFFESLGEPIHNYSATEFGWLLTIHTLEEFQADGIYLDDELAKQILSAHPNLRELRSQNTRLTTSGAAAIAQHKNLRTVRLYGDASMDEAVVREFEKMTQLEYISVDGPAINSNILLRLKKSLPNCKVHGPWQRD